MTSTLPQPRPVRRRRPHRLRRRRTGQGRAGGARRPSGQRSGRPTTPTPSTAPGRASEVYSIDTPPPTVSRLAARRPRLLLHAHRPDRALPADAGQVGVLPDGLGRQRPADRAPGAELLRRPLRPVAALRRRLHPAGEAATPSGRSRSAGPTSSSCASGSSRRTSRSSRTCGARSASPSTGTSTTRPSARRRRTRQPAGVPAQLRPRRGLPAGGAHAVGRHLPDRRRPGRARGARVRRPLPPGRLPRPAASRSTSRPPGPS